MKTNKDYAEFLSTDEAPPQGLSHLVKRDLSLSHRAPAIFRRFFVLQAVGAVLSLFICPQFGLGLTSGHGLSHIFRMWGDLACAGFCASVFFALTNLVTFLGMMGDEVAWLWSRYRAVLGALPALVWGFFMLLDLTTESVLFHFSWIGSAILLQALLLTLRSALNDQASLKTWR